MNQLMSDKAVYRTALATPGLLNRVGMYVSKDSKSRRTSNLQDRFKSNNNLNDVFSSMINIFYMEPVYCG